SLSYLRVRNLARNFAFSYPAKLPPPGTGDGDARPAYTNVRWHGHKYRVFRRQITAQDGRYSLEIGIPLDTIHHVLGLLQTIFIPLIPAVILVACAGSIWLSRRALKPVDTMTSAARAISIDNLS